eukprot:14790481-Ditylum_brightwellii.AAC.1
MDATQLERQLEIYKIAVKIFFNEDSLFYGNINSLFNEVVAERATFKMRCALDEEIATTFLYCVDTKVQRFLPQCKLASDQSEVSDSTLNFSFVLNQ